MGQGASTALPPQPWAAPEVDSQAVARALGAVPVVSGPVAPQPDASGRYVLLGVVAEGGGIPSARRSHGGVALIATDGQRARPYAVGATVDGRWVVQAVTNRTVVLQPMGAAPAGKQTTPDNAPGTITLVLPKP